MANCILVGGPKDGEVIPQPSSDTIEIRTWVKSEPATQLEKSDYRTLGNYKTYVYKLRPGTVYYDYQQVIPAKE